MRKEYSICAESGRKAVNTYIYLYIYYISIFVYIVYICIYNIYYVYIYFTHAKIAAVPMRPCCVAVPVLGFP